MIDIFVDKINKEKYIVGEYYLRSSKSLTDAAYDLAVGQSIGNPSVRNEWETPQLIEDHCCVIDMGDKKVGGKSKDGKIKIGFPYANIDINEDGYNHLICMLMGGQMDIDHIKECRLTNVDMTFSCKPMYGISGLRAMKGQYNKPLLGGILKPKTGLSPDKMFDIVKMMVDGGVDFIKEDEILGSPSFCRQRDRGKNIAEYCDKHNVMYCFCINADPHKLYQKLDDVSYYFYRSEETKLNTMARIGVHINIWSGLGAYNSIRKKNRTFIHFQKSGDKVWTDKRHKYGIDWKVICKLACMIGVDSIHVGMIGGYLDEKGSIEKIVKMCQKHNVVPALSCGFHPGLVDYVTSVVGNDYMANVGGAIHGHPRGTLAGTKAMRQAIDCDYGKEYNEAIEKWGQHDS